jgi:hypothetical protein
MSGVPQKRGLTLKVGKKASDALKTALLPLGDTMAPISTVALEMFAVQDKPKAKAKAKPKAPVAPVEAEEKVPPPPLSPPPESLRVKKRVENLLVPAVAAPAVAVAAPEEEEEQDLVSILEEQQGPTPILTSGLESLPPDEKEMAILIQEEEKRDSLFQHSMKKERNTFLQFEYN